MKRIQKNLVSRRTNATPEASKSFRTRSIKTKAVAKTEYAIFVHAHVQGYDETGAGLERNTDFYDRYGAPYYEGGGSMPPNDEEEGWAFIEERIDDYNNTVAAKAALDFPTVKGFTGGAHTYKPYHDTTPWKWTGWVPLQESAHGTDRSLPTLRGNEVQNNLWDYDPYSSDAGIGEYLGGYWYEGQAFARYLHINSLVAIGSRLRFNSIVHPLYYPRYTQNGSHLNNTTDGMQKAINEIDTEAYINSQEWGGQCHSLEVFNDFSYYYSYVTPNGTTPEVGNGDLDAVGIDGKTVYNWVDTYPLEFGIFLLDNMLSSGKYLYSLSGNDSYYDKNEEPPEKRKRPKVNVDGNPYGDNTVYGYTSLIIDQGQLAPGSSTLDQDEDKLVTMLREGMYVSSTGLHNLLNLNDGALPYTVEGQTDDLLVTQMSDEMDLVFEFPRATEAGAKALWMYHLEGYAPDGNDDVISLVGKKYLQRVTGYFKLHTDHGTRLDLGKSWDKNYLKWIRFEAIDADNPQRRAWYNPIRGLNFDGSSTPEGSS